MQVAAVTLDRPFHLYPTEEVEAALARATAD
jgi:hypothetical protein